MCQESWKRVYHDWEYKFWDDDDLRNLISTHYPEYLRFYDSLPVKICRIDAARCFILHFHGGLYADLDYYCHKKMDLDNVSIALVGSNAGDEVVQNSMMASIPGHPFWVDTFYAMVDELRKAPIAPSLEREWKKHGEYVIVFL